MVFDRVPLFGCERFGAVQDLEKAVVDFAHVVEKGGKPQRRVLFAPDSVRRKNDVRKVRDPT